MMQYIVVVRVFWKPTITLLHFEPPIALMSHFSAADFHHFLHRDKRGLVLRYRYLVTL